MDSSYSPESPRIEALLRAIAQMPESWALTPCVGKRNLWQNWSTERLDRTILTDAIQRQVNADGKTCKWTGVSVVTGPLSNGVAAVDFDGPLALQKYLELSGGQIPPTTMK